MTANENDVRQRFRFLRRLLRWTAITLLVLLFLIAAVIGFGTSGTDFSRLSSFTESVQQWQTNTEFRQVAMQYVTRGSDAMRSRPMGFTAAGWIIMIRSNPLMPKGFALNETSELHYHRFSMGPLTAYLHLCTEVDLRGDDLNSGYMGEIETRFGNRRPAARRGTQPTDQELLTYLQNQHWEYPVSKDAGAVQSLRAMLEDSEVDRGYSVRERHIDQLLRVQIARLAAELSLPTSPEEMSPEQQYAVFDRLDDYVRRHDYELWRTKQLSDFLGGMWGQVFSPPYTLLLTPFTRAVIICQWVVVGMMALLILSLSLRLKRAKRAIHIAPPSPIPPAPAE